MIKLELDRFPYVDKQTIQVMGRRFYDIDAERAYPSITTILGHTVPPEDKAWIDKWRNRVGHAKADKIRDDAGVRGTNVHKMLERKVRGEDPQLSTFPPEHVKIFTSLKVELSKVNTVYGQEVVLYSDVFGVAGRCDMIAEYQGEMAIVDYKTSTRFKSADDIGDYWLQATFYALAHNEMFGTDISKLVIMMGVENKLPMCFKKRIDDEMIVKLDDRARKFYREMAAL
jgi:hypothetical protein